VRRPSNDQLKLSHFKAVVETITVWLPADLNDEEAEPIVEEFEDAIQAATQAVQDFAQEKYPKAVVS
jgi:hypothetical protein